MNLRIVSVLMLVLALSPVAQALVDPVPSALQVQNWMAQIYIRKDGVWRPFCKGALINPRWILTTGYCLWDPYEVRGPRRTTAAADYAVRFGTSATLHEVESFVRSSDLVMGLMQLAEPVGHAPVALSMKRAEELRGQPVFITGTETSLAVRDAYFNPDFGKAMHCTVDGLKYFGSGKFCYLLTRTVASEVLLETRAVAIDPESAHAPRTALDTSEPFDKTGRRLYLDFRASASYPCHEDLGAPILRRNEQGRFEMAGIVAGVGMAAEMPVCNPSLQNVFGAVAHYREFIDRTLVQHAFAATCPATPAMAVEYPGGMRVRLSWRPVAGAQGYKLQYTARVGYEPFTVLDVGNRTALETDISGEFTYHVVIVAYNDTCTSPLSPELPVAL